MSERVEPLNAEELAKCRRAVEFIDPPEVGKRLLATIDALTAERDGAREAAAHLAGDVTSLTAERNARDARIAELEAIQGPFCRECGESIEDGDACVMTATRGLVHEACL